MMEPLGQPVLNGRYWLRSAGCLTVPGPVVLRVYWPMSDPKPLASRRWERWL